MDNQVSSVRHPDKPILYEMSCLVASCGDRRECIEKAEEPFLLDSFCNFLFKHMSDEELQRAQSKYSDIFLTLKSDKRNK